jgi:hypothetical protein
MLKADLRSLIMAGPIDTPSKTDVKTISEAALNERMASLTQVPWLEAVAVWFVSSAVILISYWGSLDDSLRSPDNVMRLVEVRAFLNGAPWFNPFEGRLAPPDGYMTHWSRMIDAGLVGLYSLARLFAAPDMSEKLMRALWPLLLVLPAIIACAAMAQRLANAGFAGLIFAVSSAAMMPTFRPGEIDHHNAQIMLVLVATACVFFADRSRLAAVIAGIASGILLGVGFEAIYMFAIIMAATAVLALIRPDDWSRPAALTLGAAAITTVLVWLGTMPRALRFAPICDALSVNTAVPVLIGGGGAAALFALGGKLGTMQRILALGIIGACALAVFAGFEPRCLQGPYSTLDAAIFPLWLDRVEEVQSLWALAKEDPMDSIIHLTFPLVAMAGGIVLIRRGLSCPQAWIVLAIFLAAFIVMVLQVRGALFAIWLGVPIAAAAVQKIAEGFPAARVEIVRLIGLAIANPIVSTLAVSILGGLYTEFSTRSDEIKTTRSDNQGLSACSKPGSYSALAKLPKGVAMGHLDFGPAVLANTHHSVIAAPYHRIQKAIIFNQQVLEGTVSDAKGRIRASNVDYVVECKAYLTRDAKKLSEKGRDMFRLALLNEQPIDWLEPIDMGTDTPIRVWRVKR